MMQLSGEEGDSIFYHKIKSLCLSGRLSMVLVIAPPRTNSTLVEHVIGNSPDVDRECHEPFFGAGRPGFVADHGYRRIFESVAHHVSEESRRPVRIAIKEIAQWLLVNGEHKRLIELAAEPIFLLIRNPLLAVESRIQKVLASAEARRGETRLDLAAKEHGYANWVELLAQKVTREHDYRCFADLLRESSREWASEEADFSALETMANHLATIGKRYHVLDTTDLRAEPLVLVQELCRLLRISYAPRMIDWGREPIDFHTTQHHEASRLWYDSLRQSTRIKPPAEIPMPIGMFPDFIQDYLARAYLPAYYKLAAQKILSRLGKTHLNNIAVEMEITPKNREILTRLGVLAESAKDGVGVVPLKFIDPVYAVSNDPSLLTDAAFRKKKTAYDTELALAINLGFA